MTDHKPHTMIKSVVYLYLLMFYMACESVHGFSTPTKTRTTTSSSASSPLTKTINRDILKKLSKCKSGTTARSILSQTFPEPSASLYQSISIPKGASELTISDAELAIQTNIRNGKYSVMELIELNGDKDADRASLALFSLFIASSFSAIGIQQYLPGPEILRFTVVWALCFSPFVFIGYGIATPSALQSFLVSLQRQIFPSYRKRMIVHEAGHFLVGHLLGLPIKGYRANAIKNAVEFYPLKDDDVGKTRASLLGFEPLSDGQNEQLLDPAQMLEEDRPFFSPDGRGAEEILTQSVFRNGKNYTDNPFLQIAIAPENDVSQSWPYRGFDHETLDQLSVVSVAGVCSEILAYGNAEGGYADLSQLRQLYNGAEPSLEERDMDNRIRYSIGFAMAQLRRNLGALDVLVDIMENDGSVEECIVAIESCENVSGATVMGNYEGMRKEKYQGQSVGIVERFLLGGSKNADTQDDRVIEGKGGGDREESFVLTGDDPFYIALGVAFVFFVWASNGGLALH